MASIAGACARLASAPETATEPDRRVNPRRGDAGGSIGSGIAATMTAASAAIPIAVVVLGDGHIHDDRPSGRFDGPGRGRERYCAGADWR
jgi:hypothetical protein